MARSCTGPFLAVSAELALACRNFAAVAVPIVVETS